MIQGVLVELFMAQKAADADASSSTEMKHDKRLETIWMCIYVRNWDTKLNVPNLDFQIVLDYLYDWPHEFLSLMSVDRDVFPRCTVSIFDNNRIRLDDLTQGARTAKPDSVEAA